MLGRVDDMHLLGVGGDVAGAFAQLRLVELTAPEEARRPSVRALTAKVAAARPGLAGLPSADETAPAGAQRLRPAPAAAPSVRCR